MKRTIIILSILIAAALAGCLWMKIDNVILEKTHPLKYTEYVEKYSAQYSVPKEIIYGVIKTESGYDSDVVSKKGAIGLMQITPETFEWLCSKEPCDDTNPQLLYNPEINIHYGTYFLSLLYTEFGTWENAFAAYNAGRGKVTEWLSQEEHSSNGRLVDIPYPETAEYVEKVIDATENYSKLYFDGKELFNS